MSEGEVHDRPVGANTGAAEPAFSMGDIAVHLLSDGQVPYPTDFVFPNAPKTGWTLAWRVGWMTRGRCGSRISAC